MDCVAIQQEAQHRRASDCTMTIARPESARDLPHRSTAEPVRSRRHDLIGHDGEFTAVAAPAAAPAISCAVTVAIAARGVIRRAGSRRREHRASFTRPSHRRWTAGAARGPGPTHPEFAQPVDDRHGADLLGHCEPHAPADVVHRAHDAAIHRVVDDPANEVSATLRKPTGNASR